jgi:hypothetical protein
MSCEMDVDVKKKQVENTSLGSIKFYIPFFPMTRELLQLVFFLPIALKKKQKFIIASQTLTGRIF